MDLMKLRRKLLLNGELNQLSNIYQEVEWLDTIGTNPYIDTGLTIDNEIDVEVKCYVTRAEAFVFGARQSKDTGPYFNLNYVSNRNSLRFDCYTYKAVPEHDVYVDNVRNAIITFSFKNKIMKVINSDTVTTKDYSNIEFAQQNRSIYLFAVHTGDNVSIAPRKGILRIYYARFWSDNILVRNFVPCIRITDNEPGMYDLVTEQFYTNQGAGNFVPGPVIY